MARFARCDSISAVRLGCVVSVQAHVLNGLLQISLSEFSGLSPGFGS